MWNCGYHFLKLRNLRKGISRERWRAYMLLSIWCGTADKLSLFKVYREKWERVRVWPILQGLSSYYRQTPSYIVNSSRIALHQRRTSPSFTSFTYSPCMKWTGTLELQRLYGDVASYKEHWGKPNGLSFIQGQSRLQFLGVADFHQSN